jgi:hypothetical protein
MVFIIQEMPQISRKPFSSKRLAQKPIPLILDRRQEKRPSFLLLPS